MLSPSSGEEANPSLRNEDSLFSAAVICDIGSMTETAEPEAAVAIVCARQPEDSVLLIRRSEREDDSWSGHWSFPGGRRDPQDTDLLHTALRELEEECGIHLDREYMRAALPQVVARRMAGPFVLVAPFLFEVERELCTVLDVREAVEAVWIPRSLLLDPAQHCLRCVPARPKEMLYPSINLNGVPLWGFTYRLITDWLSLVPAQDAAKEAGFEAAHRVLDFLLAHGLALQHGWEDRTVGQGAAAHPLKVAKVKGVIPVELVVAHFGVGGSQFPVMNMLEVHPERIRMMGLAFEEYLISASG